MIYLPEDVCGVSASIFRAVQEKSERVLWRGWGVCAGGM